MKTIAMQSETRAYSPLRSYLLEAKYEFLRLLRTPSFAIPSLLFPALFYLLFGLLLNRGKGEIASYLLATYGVFGVMGAGMFGFGVTVALEREKGFLDYKRALPMPPGAYVFAKMTMAMLFSALICLLLAGLAVAVGGVSMQAWQWAALFAIDVIGVLPYCAIGLFVGTLIGGQGAPAAINLMYLPMAFLSGLWLPMNMLPKSLQTLAPLWPSYHHAQIALTVVGAGDRGAILGHFAALAAVTGIFSFFALRRLARA